MIKLFVLSKTDIATFKRLLPKVIGTSLLLSMGFLCAAMTYVGTLW